MWPGQMNYGPGYGQSQRFYPTQDYTQHSVMQMTSQAKERDVFLSQPNALSQQPQYVSLPVKKQTGMEQVTTRQPLQEPCIVRLSSQRGDSNAPAESSAQDGFVFHIVPKGGISGNPKQAQYVSHGHIPSLHVHQGTRPIQHQLPNVGLKAQVSRSNLQIHHHNMPSLKVGSNMQAYESTMSNQQVKGSNLQSFQHHMPSLKVGSNMQAYEGTTMSNQQGSAINLQHVKSTQRSTDGEQHIIKTKHTDTSSSQVGTPVTVVSTTEIGSSAAGIKNTAPVKGNTGIGVTSSAAKVDTTTGECMSARNTGIGDFTTGTGNTIVRMWETNSGIKNTTSDMWNTSTAIRNTDLGIGNTTGMWNTGIENTSTGMIGNTSVGMWEAAVTGMGDSTSGGIRDTDAGMWNTHSSEMWNTQTGYGDAASGIRDSTPPVTTQTPVNSNRFQTVLTLQWLIENYETCEGYSVPRCFVYDQYIEFCTSNSFGPINPATFGKLIRQVFINLKTRRLGIRGQSKYHYYGIRVKPTSSLSHSSEHITKVAKISKRWTIPSKVEVIPDTKPSPDDPLPEDLSKKSSDSVAVDRSLSPVTALGLALLPQFPKAYMLTSLPSTTNIHQVDAFLTKYRTHCEYLLEAILKGKFSEIYSIMMTFWQELSATNLQLLQMTCLAGIIKFCDILLYKTIISILIPGTTQEVPQSLLKAVRTFAKDFRSKLSKYIQKLPKKVFEAKNQAAESFVKLLVRKSTLSHIAQATRSILNNSRAVKMMRADWREKTDLENLRRQIDWLIVDVQLVEDRPKLCSYFHEFDGLLEDKATVEEHVEWIEGVMKAFVNKTSGSEEKSMQNFLLYVSSISELVLRDHTLRSASSFGSYHLLHMLYAEYLLYRIETTNLSNVERQLMNQQIAHQYSERYSVPQLEKAVSVVYSELNNAGAVPPTKTIADLVKSPNTSGLCIAEDDDDAYESCNEDLPSSAGNLDNKELPAKSSSLIDVPTAISEERTQDPKCIPSGETSSKVHKSVSLTGCSFPHLSPHPQRAVIAGKNTLVPPELMSNAPSYVAAKVIKMAPKSEDGSKAMAGQPRRVCKVKISPDQANNLFKGQLIDAENGVQFIVNEVHNLPRRKSTTALKSPITHKIPYISPAKASFQYVRKTKVCI